MPQRSFPILLPEPDSLEPAIILPDPVSADSSHPARFIPTGPPIRPLDYSRLADPVELFKELGKTAEEMGQWLALLQSEMDDLLAIPIEAEEGNGVSDGAAQGLPAVLTN